MSPQGTDPGTRLADELPILRSSQDGPAVSLWCRLCMASTSNYDSDTVSKSCLALLDALAVFAPPPWRKLRELRSRGWEGSDRASLTDSFFATATLHRSKQCRPRRCPCRTPTSSARCHRKGCLGQLEVPPSGLPSGGCSPGDVPGCPPATPTTAPFFLQPLPPARRVSVPHPPSQPGGADPCPPSGRRRCQNGRMTAGRWWPA